MSISNTNQKKTIMVRLKTMINLSTSKSIMKLLMGIWSMTLCTMNSSKLFLTSTLINGMMSTNSSKMSWISILQRNFWNLAIVMKHLTTRGTKSSLSTKWNRWLRFTILIMTLCMFVRYVRTTSIVWMDKVRMAMAASW